MCDLIEAEMISFFPDKGYGFARDIHGEEFFIHRNKRAFATLNDAETEVKLDLDTAGVLLDPVAGEDIVLLINEDVASENGHRVEAVKWAYKENYVRKLIRTQNKIRNNRRKKRSSLAN